MHAVQLADVGSQLDDRDVPRPVAGPGEVVVKVAAAGVCHSDAHYRAGTSRVAFTPITLGHEVAGEIAEIGEGVSGVSPGDRVALHYLVSCGICDLCAKGLEQFCRSGRMIGKHRDGGFAEFIVVPAQNAVPVPEEVSIEAAAIMMCSAATAFHAIRRAGLAAGESAAVFGVGGLGMSAVQLARIAGASTVYAVDVDAGKLRKAEGYGAIPVDAGREDSADQLRRLTGGAGVDVSLEFSGRPQAQSQAVAALSVHGRAALAGITDTSFSVSSYGDLLNREAQVCGVSDHLRSELSTLMQFCARRLLDLDSVIAARIRLDASQINPVLDELEQFRGLTRTVILP